MPKNGLQERQSARFNIDKILGRPDVALSAVGSGPGWRPELSSPPPSIAQGPHDDYWQHIRQTYQTPYVPRPATVADIPPDSRKDIVTKADKFGFPTREHASDWQIMVNSRWISWREWDGRPPD